MSVDNEMKEEYGETECDKAMSEDGDVLCVVYEGFEETGIHAAWNGKKWRGGGGGWWMEVLSDMVGV